MSLRTRQLDLRVGTRLLLTQLDWEVRPGECWCLIGRNGAGKTTLLQTLAGLRAPDAGNVCIDDRSLPQWRLPALARQRAYLPQQRQDAFGYSALETVLAARHAHGLDGGWRFWESAADERAAWNALEAVHAVQFAHRDVRSLSGGERQRVAIAAVLAQDTPLLLLDEPANALDLAHQVGAMRLLARLCREQAKSVVLVSHDLNLVQQAASHVLLLMGDGRWQVGTADAMLQAEPLGDCLGYPIDVIEHHERRLILPSPCQGEQHA